MANLEVLALDPATPQIEAPQTGNGYSMPRLVNIAPEAVTGTATTPSLAIAQAWSTTGAPTALQVNVTADTGPSVGSKLLDLQVGGVSKASIDKVGVLRLPANGTDPAVNIGGSLGITVIGSYVGFGNTGYSNFIAMTPTGDLTIGRAIDLILARDAANTLAQRNGVNAQAFNLYNTYTDTSNYERGFMRWNTNVFQVGSEKAGTGVDRANKYFLSSRSDQYLQGSADGYSVTLQSRYGTAFGTCNAGIFFPLGIAVDAEGRGLTITSHTAGATPSYVNANNIGSATFRVGYAYNSVPNGSGFNFLSSYGATPTSAGNGGFGGKFSVWIGQGGLPNGAGSNGTDGAFEILPVDRSGTIGTVPVFSVNYSGNIVVTGDTTVSDAKNIAVGTTTGTKIGTATSQKLGFWNTIPIAQPTTAVAAATVAATGLGDIVAASTTFDGYTIPQIVKALRNAGLLA